MIGLDYSRHKQIVSTPTNAEILAACFPEWKCEMHGIGECPICKIFSRIRTDKWVDDNANPFEW